MYLLQIQFYHIHEFCGFFQRFFLTDYFPKILEIIQRFFLTFLNLSEFASLSSWWILLRSCRTLKESCHYYYRIIIIIQKKKKILKPPKKHLNRTLKKINNNKLFSKTPQNTWEVKAFAMERSEEATSLARLELAGMPADRRLRLRVSRNTEAASPRGFACVARRLFL